MRITRIISVVVALVLGTALSLALVSSPGAATEPDERAKPARDVSISFGGGTGSFSLTGKVSPKGKGLKVSLQYKRTRGGNWKTIKKDGANQKQKYAFYGLKQVGFFRTKVPQSRGYKTSYSRVIKVVRR